MPRLRSAFGPVKLRYQAQQQVLVERMSRRFAPLHERAPACAGALFVMVPARSIEAILSSVRCGGGGRYARVEWGLSFAAWAMTVLVVVEVRPAPSAAPSPQLRPATTARALPTVMLQGGQQSHAD
jgi:hypothetical protein